MPDTTKLPSAVNAALSTIRAVARTCADGRARSELEQARFSLWVALEADELDNARGWLAATRANAIAAGEEVRPLVERALATIEAHLDGAAS